eukprot:511194-Heterocapsa_arctica.AAC.1
MQGPLQYYENRKLNNAICVKSVQLAASPDKSLMVLYLKQLHNCVYLKYGIGKANKQHISLSE